MRRLLYVVIGTFLFAAGEAQAQVDRATLTGTVKDSTGAVVPGATVTVTGPQAPTATTTNAEGTYLVVSLVPGRYVVAAEMSGFQKASRTVILEVGQRGRVDFALGVGGATETVTVQGEVRLLNTEQSSLGTVMDQGKVANLPLAIRNWDDLLALVPGVQGDRFTEQGGGTSFGRTGGVNVHGVRAIQNNFLLDGVDNNSISENVQELTTQVSRPSVDAIQEFKVVTSPYSAEYGRSPGAAISVSTKSGTNDFHGTAYDFYRNQSLDSNDFFSKRANVAKPPNKQNQFGANLGGPISKDKAYFFADYEGTRITRGVTRITNVPTADQRNGIFTTAVKDPLTGANFANNTIPANRIDPTAAAILALVPLPNQPGANNFLRVADITDNNDRLLTRLDLHLSQNDNVFARYIYSNRQRNIPGAFGGVLDGTGTSAFGDQTIKTNGVVGGWTRIFSPTVVNELRFNWQQSTSDARQQPFGQQPTGAALVRNSITDPIVAGGLPGISIDTYFQGSGLGRLGSPDFLPKFQHTNQYELLDSVSWLKGRHAFKLGADLIMMKNQFMDVPATRGSLTFRNKFTGNSLADYLLGYVSDFQLSNVYAVDQRHSVAMFFVQDDWKVNSKLSLNLGLRYDFITPALEASNRQTNFNPAGTGSLVFAKDGSLEERGLVKPDRNNFAPRLGFVYKIDDRTLVRGGYGIFYNLFDRVGSEDQLSLNVPGLINNTVTSSSTAPLFLLQNGFPAGFLNPPSLDPAAGDLRRIRLRAVAHDAPKTRLQQASIGFQRELIRNVVISADGVWTKGSNLATLVNLNQPLPNAAGSIVGQPVPYPNFGTFIEWRADNGKSEYKGIDLGLERRFANGFGFGVAYTLGDSKDNSSEQLTTQGSNAFPQDARNFTNWYGPSDYDVRHRLAVNYVVELPFGKGKKFAESGVGATLLGGWTWSGIFAWRSGRPFTVNQSGNNVGTNMTGLPNVTGGTNFPKTVDHWFTADGFQAVPSGTFGNETRNQFRGPSYKSFDMSLARGFHTGSRVLATLRWDVFNVFNTVNLGLPNRNLSSLSTLGTISSLAGDARVMQLSVRLAF
jgi:Carboxypeptidase regulatory-like domain/TonB dependent receptor-like, beta-barrel/TonB-dependent Receptor Plug Domain